MAKKKVASKKASPKKQPQRERYVRLFDEILKELPENEHAAYAIVRALEVVASELSDLNTAASEIYALRDSMADVVHHLEEFDGHLTDLVHNSTESSK